MFDFYFEQRWHKHKTIDESPVDNKGVKTMETTSFWFIPFSNQILQQNICF